LSHAGRAVAAAFDDPNLVSCAGLVPVMRLAEQVDLAGLVASALTLKDCRVGDTPWLVRDLQVVSVHSRSWGMDRGV
jgi:hypothetical protein